MAKKEIQKGCEWATDLKVGDTVFIESRFRLTKEKVTKLTKTQIGVGEHDQRYNRYNLTHRIDSWSSDDLKQATPEREAEYQKRISCNKISSLAHETYNSKTKKSTLEKMSQEELNTVIIAISAVIGLFDEVEKRVK